MQPTQTQLKEQRLQKLFDDCQQQVLSQIIGPFGLSTAMFEDRNGGNVTTLKNFSGDDTSYIAEKDHATHAQANKAYEREDYETAGWDNLSKTKRAEGKDGYTGKDADPSELDLDHVTSLKTLSESKKVHLALETGDSVDRVTKMANHDDNLVTTNKSINRSKGSQNLDEFAEGRGKKFDLDDKSVAQATQRSDAHINKTVNHALLKKQGTELLQTGGTQALRMGLRQAMGVLLTELVNGLFNEFKVLIKQGIEAGKTLFEEVKERLGRIIGAVVKKIPDALGKLFQGGVSGFMSNLLTFLLNSFFSTAKRLVTTIREGLLGLFKAFKMILFPPKHMSSRQAMQEGLKVLTAVVVTSIGLLLQESVSAFMATVPFLKPIADLITPIFIAILTGLCSAFLAYQIDILFDKYLYSSEEKKLDELIADAARREEFANHLVESAEVSLRNIDNYNQSITMYQAIGASLASTNFLAQNTSLSLQRMLDQTREQVASTYAGIDYINTSQLQIEAFLKTI